MTSAMKEFRDYWVNVGVQKERERMATERKQDVRKLLSAGADERLLLTVYSPDEIREAKDSPTAVGGLAAAR